MDRRRLFGFCSRSMLLEPSVLLDAPDTTFYRAFLASDRVVRELRIPDHTLCLEAIHRLIDLGVHVAHVEMWTPVWNEENECGCPFFETCRIINLVHKVLLPGGTLNLNWDEDDDTHGALYRWCPYKVHVDHRHNPLGWRFRYDDQNGGYIWLGDDIDADRERWERAWVTSRPEDSARLFAAVLLQRAFRRRRAAVRVIKRAWAAVSANPHHPTGDRVLKRRFVRWTGGGA